VQKKEEPQWEEGSEQDATELLGELKEKLLVQEAV
jgi:hypothetical protein